MEVKHFVDKFEIDYIKIQIIKILNHNIHPAFETNILFPYFYGGKIY